MLCTILPVLYLSMLLLPLGLRKMAAPCQSPEGARSGSAIIGYASTKNNRGKKVTFISNMAAILGEETTLKIWKIVSVHFFTWPNH